MKITIDTKHDSHIEIRKAIRLLYSLIGEKEVYTNEPGEKPTNIFEDSSPEVGNMMSLFDNVETPESPATPETPDPKKPSLEFY